MGTATRYDLPLLCIRNRLDPKSFVYPDLYGFKILDPE